MDFPEFCKELEANFRGEGSQLIGLQLLQLKLRLGKNPSRSFEPVKSAEIFWQIWASCSFRVSLVHDSRDCLMSRVSSLRLGVPTIFGSFPPLSRLCSRVP
ncbi:hypothetical protein Tco_0282272 [Tanacetum coccineum]